MTTQFTLLSLSRKTYVRHQISSNSEIVRILCFSRRLDKLSHDTWHGGRVPCVTCMGGTWNMGGLCVMPLGLHELGGGQMSRHTHA